MKSIPCTGNMYPFKVFINQEKLTHHTLIPITQLFKQKDITFLAYFKNNYDIILNIIQSLKSVLFTVVLQPLVYKTIILAFNLSIFNI